MLSKKVDVVGINLLSLGPLNINSWLVGRLALHSPPCSTPNTAWFWSTSKVLILLSS